MSAARCTRRSASSGSSRAGRRQGHHHRGDAAGDGGGQFGLDAVEAGAGSIKPGQTMAPAASITWSATKPAGVWPMPAILPAAMKRLAPSSRRFLGSMGDRFWIRFSCLGLPKSRPEGGRPAGLQRRRR